MTTAELQGWVEAGGTIIVALGVLYNIVQGQVARHALKAAEHKADARAGETSAAIGAIAGDVIRVEKATNSMKDALVAAAGAAADLAGGKRGIEIGLAQAAGAALPAATPTPPSPAGGGGPGSADLVRPLAV